MGTKFVRKNVASLKRQMSMKKFLFFVASILFIPFCAYAQTQKEIEQYVSFLKNENTTAKDYVLSLFESNDIVILCERDHRELTQYKLFLEIIRDQYFIDNVGIVFTEVGARNLNPELNIFLQNKHLTELEINKQLLYFQRNCMFPLWEKSNFSYFLKGIYDINKEITQKKVEMYPTDVFYIEGQPTSEKIRDMVFTRVVKRDSLMADYIISRFEQLKQETSRRKALVIMNYRHAFRFPVYDDNGRRTDNTGQYLFDKYPKKVANVMINNIIDISNTSTGDIFGVVQDGKWDAVFKKTDKENLGFNFTGSPFGNDIFDYWVYKNDFTYKNVFNGFIFYQPFEKFEIAVGLSGLMDNGFYEEYVERNNLYYQAFNREMPPPVKDEIMRLNEIRISEENELDKIKIKIEKWLK